MRSILAAILALCLPASATLAAPLQFTFSGLSGPTNDPSTADLVPPGTPFSGTLAILESEPFEVSTFDTGSTSKWTASFSFEVEGHPPVLATYVFDATLSITELTSQPPERRLSFGAFWFDDSSSFANDASGDLLFDEDPFAIETPSAGEFLAIYNGNLLAGHVSVSPVQTPEPNALALAMLGGLVVASRVARAQGSAMACAAVK